LRNSAANYTLKRKHGEIAEKPSLCALNCTICFKSGFFYLFLYKKSCKMHFEKLVRTIKERREVLQVTQETLANLSGVGLRTLKQFESGKGNPTLLTLQKLADVLGLEIGLKIKNMTRNDETGKNSI
jgi:DNA-binding XRE family transcriptional regulator